MLNELQSPRIDEVVTGAAPEPLINVISPIIERSQQHNAIVLMDVQRRENWMDRHYLADLFFVSPFLACHS
ncbi:MAG: hypothetical protein KDN22_12270 [Verrucomicrobiae bacterium]|nr:hypothetical protein [Verrucomicrobiae bacterium]